MPATTPSTAAPAPVAPAIDAAIDARSLVGLLNWSATPLGPRDAWQERLKSAVDIALAHPLPMCVLWGRAFIQIYNDGYATIAGDKHPAAMGRPAAETWPELADAVDPICRAVLEGGETVYREHMPLAPDRGGGSDDAAFFTLCYSPLRDDDGGIGGVLVTVIETTANVRAERERRAVEQALRESEERYRLVNRATNEAIWDWHVPSDVLLWNEAVEHVFGHTLADIPPLVEWWHGQIHADDRDRVVDGIRALIDGGGEAWRDEYRFRRADGTYATVFDRGFVYRDESGQAVRMIGSMLDLTERRQAEEELRRARDQAEAASRAKDEFIAVLSHELRTPLTPVLLTVALMEAHPQLPEDLRREVATIRQNVELESRLISDLLDLTRVARGKLELHLTTTDAHEIITSAAGICRREEGPEVVLGLSAGRHHVRADSARLQQVFWNLINNAQKFTPDDGTISIRTTNPRGGRALRVEVIDTGAGIEPEVLPRLFNAFEQGADRLPRQFGGLGLGLAISKSLVKAHGGRIAAHSEGRNRGARFVVDLPLVPTPSAKPIARPAPAPSPAGPAKPLRILIVEDHPATAEAMRKLLARLGHAASIASTLASGKLALQAEPFDVVLSDLGLPDGSGLELLQDGDARARYAGRAIALTGFGMEDDVRRTQAAGFAAHVTKPVDFARLEQLIQRLTTTVGGR